MENIWNIWIQKMKDKHFSPRNGNSIHTYKHFSVPFKKIEDILSIKDEFLNPLRVKLHNFSPLLSFLKKTPVFSHKQGLKREKWKVRPLMYADHPDAWLYSWYSHLLATKYETLLKENGLEKVVSAYRQDILEIPRTNASIAKELFNFISNRPSNESWDILLFDVEKFYDTLHPYLLKRAWCRILDTKILPDDHYAIYKSIIDYGVVRKNRMQEFLNKKFGPIGGTRKKCFSQICSNKEFHYISIEKGLIETKGNFLKSISSEMDKDNPERFFSLVDNSNIGTVFYKGIPQGLPISPTLANIYMFEFDKLLQAKLFNLNGFHRRYADDIAIVCPSVYSEEIKKFVMETIQDPKIANLNIQEKKTEHYRFLNNEISSLKEGDSTKNPNTLFGITYLGLIFQGGKGYIKSGTIAKGHQRIKRLVRVNFGRKKKGKSHYSKEQIQRKILGSGLFGYISMCANHHGQHIHSQYSKGKIRKILKRALEKYEEIQVGS